MPVDPHLEVTAAARAIDDHGALADAQPEATVGQDPRVD